jgi:hypothetical protein
MSAAFIMQLEHQAVKMSERAAGYAMTGERVLANTAQAASAALREAAAAMIRHEEREADEFGLKGEC